MKIGLKLWATNKNYVPCVRDLYERGLFSYLELYSVPDSYEKCVGYWRDVNVPYTIHAPHYGSGLNLSNPEQQDSNRILLEEAKRYADTLHADYIIVHPGVSGQVDETIRQFNLFKDSRFVVENKPYLGLFNNLICVGATVEQIDRIMKECGIGFCLDIGHGICAANHLKVDWQTYISRFIALNPTMYHLTDGDINSVYDSHLHYGEGSYPIHDILAMIPTGKKITNESRKNSKENLDNFAEDMKYLLNGN